MPFGNIGAETAFFGKYAATGGKKPGYTRTTYYPGGNPYYTGPRTAGVSGGGMAPAASSAIQKAIGYYQEGGGFGKGTEAALERGRTKAMTSGAQGLVSAGLAGTTMMAGLGKKFEEEVGAPMRARVEETRAQAISSLEMTKAQIIQGATESDRSRALQQYLAQLQTTQQGPTVTARPTPTAAQPVATQKDAGGYGSNYGGTGSSYGNTTQQPLISRSPAAKYWGQANVTGWQG